MSGPRFRTGTKLGRTIYCNDELIGLMDTPEIADMVVEALNGDEVDTAGRRVIYRGTTAAFNGINRATSFLVVEAPPGTEVVVIEPSGSYLGQPGQIVRYIPSGELQRLSCRKDDGTGWWVEDLDGRRKGGGIADWVLAESGQWELVEEEVSA